MVLKHYEVAGMCWLCDCKTKQNMFEGHVRQTRERRCSSEEERKVRPVAPLSCGSSVKITTQICLSHSWSSIRIVKMPWDWYFKTDFLNSLNWWTREAMANIKIMAYFSAIPQFPLPLWLRATFEPYYYYLSHSLQNWLLQLSFAAQINGLQHIINSF